MNQNPSQPSGKKVGQGMLIAAFALGLLAMTFFFDGVLQNQANPNQNPLNRETDSGIKEVVLEQNRQGHYVANGTINAVPVTFLLDTGATDVAIPENIAEAANLQRGYSGRAATANGTITVYGTQVGELTIGNIVLHDINASIMPSMPGDTILLGMSALRQIEFTQRGSRLTLRQLPDE